MHRLLTGAAAVLMFTVSAIGAPSVQGFYRVDRFYGLPGFYHQYPYTLFGYPHYNYSYYPLYHDYPDCDFVWPTVKHKTAQRGIWTCR